MSLILNRTHQLWHNAYLTYALLNKDNEQLKLALIWPEFQYTSEFVKNTLLSVTFFSQCLEM